MHIHTHTQWYKNIYMRKQIICHKYKRINNEKHYKCKKLANTDYKLFYSNKDII